jgi:3-oxoacyl-[acyl-carrier protein] reductase
MPSRVQREEQSKAPAPWAGAFSFLSSGMNLDLSGKRAIVCGSSQGIGRAIAHELATLGADIVLVARGAAKLEAVRTQLPVRAGQSHTCISTDFADLANVELLAAQLAAAAGPWKGHILINNAGGPPGGEVLAAKPAEFEAAFRVHVLAGQLLAQRLVPVMKASAYGRIVNVISTSVKAPIAGLGVSNTIRGAMASWAKTLAGEVGPFGITVNNVLPGFTTTERLTALVKAKASKSGLNEEAVARDMLASVPLGRFAEPSEIANAVAFLASPAAAYVNGINLPVDGGRLPTL